MPRKKKNILLSGYTSLQPRVRIKENDNKPGQYGTIHRCGDIDRSGNKNIVPFNDQKVIFYGRKIFDDFNNSGIGENTNIDTKNWIVSKGMRIKKSSFFLSNKRCKNKNKKLLVFTGNELGRFIQTKRKIKNPTIEIKFVKGPYDQIINGINLSKPNETDYILAQISLDNINWNTIKSYNVNTVNDCAEFIHPADIPTGWSNNEFYFRLISKQSSIGLKKDNNWAIDYINIKYYNENIIYGLNVDVSEYAGLDIANKFIATSHTTGTLSGTGRSFSQCVDDTFKDSLNISQISPFNEDLSHIVSFDTFYDSKNNSTLEGFSSPTKSKTKFCVDLSPTTKTSFGYLNKHNSTRAGSTDTTSVGQNLMVYWNNELRKWEKVGQEYNWNNTSSDTNMQIYSNMLSQSCVGFGPTVTSICTGSTVTPTSADFTMTNFHSKNYTKLSNQKIVNNAFPFGGQYHATSSQTIKASDIGITKPFLLEKIELNYDAIHQFGTYGASGADTSKLFQLKGRYGPDNDPSNKLLGVQAIVPTFFMMRQFKDNFVKNVDIDALTFSDNPSYHVTIPSNYQLVSGSTDYTLVSDNRELITFAQDAIFVTASSNGFSFEDSKGSLIDMQRIAEACFDFDNNNFITITGFLNHTGSFRVKSNTKYSNYNKNYGSINISYDSGNEHSLSFKNNSVSRSGLMKNSRAIVDGFSGIHTKESFNHFISNNASTKTTNIKIGEQKDVSSPYIIFPEDDLIFGWQYPVAQDSFQYSPASDTPDTSLPKMELFGKSKLFLYGSLVSNKKEYHETINQNLSSFCVSETLTGLSKDIDRYQTEYLGELTGSYIDNYLIDKSNPSDIKYNEQISIVPKERIGINRISFANFNNDVLRLGLTRTFDNVQRFSTQRFLKINDSKFILLDSSKKVSYYFDYRQYGNYIDIITGTKDSVLKNTENGEKINGPASVIFVYEESENVSEVDVKRYLKASIKDLLRYKNFQSSNLSTYCTSSLPFYDDNTPINRAYTGTEEDFVVI